MLQSNIFIPALEQYFSIPDFKRDFFDIARTSVDIWDGDANSIHVQMMREIQESLEQYQHQSIQHRRRFYVTIGYLAPVLAVHDPNEDAFCQALGGKADIMDCTLEYERSFYMQHEQAPILWSYDGGSCNVGLLCNIAFASLFLTFAGDNLIASAPIQVDPIRSNILPFKRRR